MKTAGSLALLGALALGCSEWVALAPEPESYPFETARRICHAHAQRESEREAERVWDPGRRERPDPGVYSRAFRECMRAHGWVLRRKGSQSEERSAEPRTG